MILLWKKDEKSDKVVSQKEPAFHECFTIMG